MAENKPIKKSGLGRGLSALLEDTNFVQNEKNFGSFSPAGIAEISVDTIETNPFQPRSEFEEEALNELAESIKVQGIIQPITVRKLEEGKYQLISGERRLRASKIAGLSQIPAYVRTADDKQMLEMAIIENIQRENLNPLEIAFSYQRLISECNLKQEELGDRVGKKRTTVNNYLRLLRLPPEIQFGLKKGQLTMGHARALVSLEKIDEQLSVFRKIIDNDLTVRKVEDLVRDLTLTKTQTHLPLPKQEPTPKADPEIRKIESKLSGHFATKVQLKADGSGKGEMRIVFHSTDDLNRILELLNL